METQYITHSYNASRTIKMIRLRNKMGYEGIGLFWAFAEYLYEYDNQLNYEDLDLIADELHADVEKLQHLIADFSLFVIERSENGTIIHLDSIKKIDEPKSELSRMRAKIGKLGSNARWRDNNASDDGKTEIVTIANDGKTEIVTIANDGKTDFATMANDGKTDFAIMANDGKTDFATMAKNGKTDFAIMAKNGKNMANDGKIFCDEKRKEAKENINTPPIGSPLTPQEGETPVVEVAEDDDGEKIENHPLPLALDASLSDKKKTRGRGAEFDFDVSSPPEWIDAKFAKTFKMWIDFKREKGQGYVGKLSPQTCYRQLVEKSGGSPEQALKLVREAIGGNWTSFGKLISQGGSASKQNPMVIDTASNHYEKF